MARTMNERISNVEEQIVQLENEKKRLLQVQKEVERKARTKRLIVRGATAEKLLGVGEEVSDKEFEALLEQVLLSSPLWAKDTGIGAEQVEG